MRLLGYAQDGSLLRKPAHPILKSEIKSLEFINNLKEMERILSLEKDGIGLAATQIGWNASVFILNIDEQLNKTDIRVFINPKIQRYSDTTTKESEGCLSFPGLSITVERPTEVIWTYMNLNEDTISQLSTDFMARAVQHEIDHLEGRLLIDHATTVQRLKINKWLKNQAR